MCSRFALTHSAPAVRRQFGFAETVDFPPRYNIAPTQPIAVVLYEGGVRHFKLMRWGFLPGWVKDPGGFPLLFNARGETAGDKPAFRAAMRYRRCLVPASAWYEWRRHGRVRTPFLVRRRDGAAMALAGLWETWSAVDGSEIDTAAIVTTTANGTLAAIDERMPVVVAPVDFDTWLNARSTHLDEATRLVRPAPDDLFEMVAIGAHIGNPRHEGPQVQEPAPAPALPRREATGAGDGPGDKGGQGSLF